MNTCLFLILSDMQFMEMIDAAKINDSLGYFMNDFTFNDFSVVLFPFPIRVSACQAIVKV